MKRMLNILLSLLLIFSLVPTALAAETASLSNFKRVNVYEAGQFKDVKSTDWYESSVKTAYEIGLVKGDSANTFNPTGSITIAETLALASRLHSIYYTGTADFVQESPWYQVYVDYAIANNIIYSSQFSNYSNKATRAQFAQILANSVDADALAPINSIEAIPDVAGSEIYASAVFQLYRAGILTGSDAKGTFNPNSNIQRSEVAAIVARVVDTTARKTISLNQCTANGHVWSPATCTSPKTCSVCGVVEGSALGHKWTAATCTAPKTCSVCGMTDGTALGHNYVNGVCLLCGAEKVGTITLPKLPLTVNELFLSGQPKRSARITDISYYYVNYRDTGEPCLAITVTGIKTYDVYGDTFTHFMPVLIVVYDETGSIVASKELLSDAGLIVGQKFSKEVILDGIDRYSDYTIKILDKT